MLDNSQERVQQKLSDLDVTLNARIAETELSTNSSNKFFKSINEREESS